jgi:ABC-type bacteriocin/lantibiotic exporter with double-glycine peptidase domain
MSWLDVPHLRQDEVGWCLPACVAMIAAYWQQPLVQSDIARWLDAQGVGIPASRVERLGQRGFRVIYRTGSLAELDAWLAQGVPCILFLRTGELSYWKLDTPHAAVLVGLEADDAYLLDPAVEAGPIKVPAGDLLLAWSHFEYTYAVLQPSA